MIYLRFYEPEDVRCCVLLGPEICQNGGFYTSSDGHVYCQSHADENCEKWRPSFKPSERNLTTYGLWSSYGPGCRPCDKVLPRYTCENDPVWEYVEVGNRKRYLCGFHAKKFMSIRPGFTEPLPRGYGAKALTIS